MGSNGESEGEGMTVKPQPNGLCILVGHLITREGWCFDCAKAIKLEADRVKVRGT
jgi:hypothetical protein